MFFDRVRCSALSNLACATLLFSWESAAAPSPQAQPRLLPSFFVAPEVKALNPQPPTRYYGTGDTQPMRHNSVSPVIDLPVTYNQSVVKWLNYFRGPGKKWFHRCIERSARYLPLMKATLAARGLPQDLAYVALIESGFSAHAVSDAAAVGYWQFIKPTAIRYGLKINWWLDERRDFNKSTLAAAQYLEDLYRQFGSWYLTASAYNMGETRLRKLIKKYHSHDFWYLSEKPGFPAETKDYIPKLLAAVLIAKAPSAYGFHDLKPELPVEYDYIFVPGGMDLVNLSRYIKLEPRELKQLNAALIKGFVPPDVFSFKLRIPKGQTRAVAEYIRRTL